VLLLAFIKYFFDRDKNKDEMWDKKYNELYENFKERETILIAESARREELLHTESDKREKLMRQEAEKRESTLMRTIDGFSKTMEKISDAMNDIRSDSRIVQKKVENIENKIEQMGCAD
jgi:prophage DNA circulation protein